MILCNLAAIMGERRLKISKVAADTGISRTTLTALYYDSGKGVQFETANLLCIYFGISMGELFSTLPFDLFVEDCMVLENSGEVVFECKLLTQRGTQFPQLRATISSGVYKDECEECIGTLIFPAKQYENSKEEIDLLNDCFNRFTTASRDVIEKRLLDALYEQLESSERYDRGTVTDFLFLTQCKFPESFVC